MKPDLGKEVRQSLSLILMMAATVLVTYGLGLLAGHVA
jgi:hypothetical protein